MVRCMVFCSEVGKTAWSPGGDVQDVVKFQVATGPGNESWSKYTPSGSAQLCITNPEAVGRFQVGKFYFLDFTPAE